MNLSLMLLAIIYISSQFSPLSFPLSVLISKILLLSGSIRFSSIWLSVQSMATMMFLSLWW